MQFGERVEVRAGRRSTVARSDWHRHPYGGHAGGVGSVFGGLGEWREELLGHGQPSRTGDRGRGALAPERLAEVRLQAWSGRAAMAVRAGELTRAEAVARLALTAPCRPDVVRAVAATAAGWAPPVAGPVGDWPPRALLAELLAATGEVTMGTRRLTGPDGITVEHVTLDRGPDRGTRRFLRVRRHDVVIAEV